ncbi:MAG TPA: hypothetical protein VEC94_17210 [Pseudolabrys sp.]|nr:hypothetical protein [Pseudolabrys sp.]
MWRILLLPVTILVFVLLWFTSPLLFVEALWVAGAVLACSIVVLIAKRAAA